MRVLMLGYGNAAANSYINLHNSAASNEVWCGTDGNVGAVALMVMVML
jgi:hypothetical protein